MCDGGDVTDTQTVVHPTRDHRKTSTRHHVQDWREGDRTRLWWVDPRPHRQVWGSESETTGPTKSRPHLVNDRLSKGRTIRWGKDQETDLSWPKTITHITDMGNRDARTTEEVEVQTRSHASWHNEEPRDPGNNQKEERRKVSEEYRKYITGLYIY